LGKIANPFFYLHRKSAEILCVFFYILGDFRKNPQNKGSLSALFFGQKG
jgi:hypothetical protein